MTKMKDHYANKNQTNIKNLLHLKSKLTPFLLHFFKKVRHFTKNCDKFLFFLKS